MLLVSLLSIQFTGLHKQNPHKCFYPQTALVYTYTNIHAYVQVCTFAHVTCTHGKTYGRNEKGQLIRTLLHSWQKTVPEW